MPRGRVVVAGAEFDLVVRWHGRIKPSFRENERKNHFSGLEEVRDEDVRALTLSDL